MISHGPQIGMAVWVWIEPILWIGLKVKARNMDECCAICWMKHHQEVFLFDAPFYSCDVRRPIPSFSYFLYGVIWYRTPSLCSLSFPLPMYPFPLIASPTPQSCVTVTLHCPALTHCIVWSCSWVTVLCHFFPTVLIYKLISNYPVDIWSFKPICPDFYS